MTVTTNCISYDQEMAERLMANSIQASTDRLRFETTYGSSTLFREPTSHSTDIEGIKDRLFSEFDDLWKELANK